MYFKNLYSIIEKRLLVRSLIIAFVVNLLLPFTYHSGLVTKSVGSIGNPKLIIVYFFYILTALTCALLFSKLNDPHRTIRIDRKGEVDYQNVSSINDDLKNEITKIIIKTQFPKTLLKKTYIVILNSLTITEGQYISVQGGKLDIPILNESFIGENGLYVEYNKKGQESISVIYIKKSALKNELVNVLSHELGHIIGQKLTDKEWEEYYKLRGIPATTLRMGGKWERVPNEDFAEVYKSIFTGLKVRTVYGEVINKATKSFVQNKLKTL